MVASKIKEHVFERIRFHVRTRLSEIAMSNAADVESFADSEARSMVYELQAKLWGRKSRTTKTVGYSGLHDVVHERARQGVKKEMDALMDEIESIGRGIIEDMPEKYGVEVETERIEILDPKTLQVIPNSAMHYTVQEMVYDGVPWDHEPGRD